MRMWFGLMAPAGTPDDIVATLSRAAGTALESEAVRAALAKQGYDPSPARASNSANSSATRS